jgi:hypothetical protein
LTLKQDKLTNEVISSGYDNQPWIGRVEIVGINYSASRVLLNKRNVSFFYDQARNLIQVPQIRINLVEPFELLLEYAN